MEVNNDIFESILKNKKKIIVLIRVNNYVC